MREKLSELIQRRLKELDISKAELARKVGVSRSYITNMANESAPTRTGQYEPGPDVTAALARALEISEDEILRAMDYIQNGRRAKPQNVADFVQRLEEMGFDFYGFDQDEAAELGPDDLQDLMEDIEAKILSKTRRRKREAITK